MSTVRKTINRSDLIEPLNALLALQEPVTPGERRAAIAVGEAALHRAGSYKGFQYLPTELDENGQLIPGYDDTRRRYS